MSVVFLASAVPAHSVQEFHSVCEQHGGVVGGRGGVGSHFAHPLLLDAARQEQVPGQPVRLQPIHGADSDLAFVPLLSIRFRRFHTFMYNFTDFSPFFQLHSSSGLSFIVSFIVVF